MTGKTLLVFIRQTDFCLGTSFLVYIFSQFVYIFRVVSEKEKIEFLVYVIRRGLLTIRLRSLRNERKYLPHIFLNLSL